MQVVEKTILHCNDINTHSPYIHSFVRSLARRLLASSKYMCKLIINAYREMDMFNEVRSDSISIVRSDGFSRSLKQKKKKKKMKAERMT